MASLDVPLTITRPGVVAPVRRDAAGIVGPTPGQARGPRWRPAAPGFHVPASTDPTCLEQRIVEAVGCLPPGSAATGWAALAWLGARWFNGQAPDGRTLLPVQVAVGDRRSIRDRPGVLLSEDWLFADDVIVIDGLPVTVPERSVTYLVRHASSLLEAVTAIDMAAYDDLVDIDGLRSYAVRIKGRPGTRRLKRALDLANENAWSPPEVMMRQVWETACDVRLLCNTPVFDLSGNHLFTPDLFDPASGVAGEYNGDVHADRVQRRRDLERDEVSRQSRIEVVTMIGGQGERDRLRARLHTAYQRAADRDRARNWTLDQPEWWVDTSTVARRRALLDREREIWLRHRRRT